MKKRAGGSQSDFPGKNWGMLGEEAMLPGRPGRDREVEFKVVRWSGHTEKALPGRENSTWKVTEARKQVTNTFCVHTLVHASEMPTSVGIHTHTPLQNWLKFCME